MFSDNYEKRVLMSVELDESAAGEPNRRVWIQIATIGQFNGHPAGPFELSPAIFSEIVRNFERDGIPIPIDAEHAGEADPTRGSIPALGAPAMGWIHELDNRGPGGLWANVEWLEPARSYIREGRYRYISPAIRFNSKDRISGQSAGAKLSSAGITNTPFLKSLPQLVAKDRVIEFAASPAQDDARNELFDVVEEMVRAVIMNEVQNLTTPEETAREQTPERAINMADNVETKAAATLLRAQAAEEMVEELKSENESLKKQLSSTKKESGAKIAELSERLERFEEREIVEEVEEAFATYKDARNLSDRDREHLLDIRKRAPESFHALYPKVDRDKAHLMRNIATSKREAPALRAAPQVSTKTQKQRYDEYILAGKSNDEATTLAFKDYMASIATSAVAESDNTRSFLSLARR